MSQQVIKHRMSWGEVDKISEQGLVDLLRSKGMDVIYRPRPANVRNQITWNHSYESGWGCVAARGSRFSVTDSGTTRIFTWTGEVTTEEERQELQSAQNFLNQTQHENDLHREALQRIQTSRNFLNGAPEGAPTSSHVRNATPRDLERQLRLED